MFFKFGSEFQDMNYDSFKKFVSEVIACIKTQFSLKFEIQKLYQVIIGERPPKASEQVLINFLLKWAKHKYSENYSTFGKVDLAFQQNDEIASSIALLQKEKSALQNLISQQKLFIDKLIVQK